MKKLLTACAAGALSCVMLLGVAACNGSEKADVDGAKYSDPALTIRAKSIANAKDISDSLFGLFLEDINYASNALDDNLVANGNFEEIGTTPAADNYSSRWTSTTGAAFAVESTEGVLAQHADYHNATYHTDVNPHYAKVTVTAANGGIRNLGYERVPMAVEKDVEYTFSAFVKSPDRAAKMTATLTDGTKDYVTVEMNVPQGSEWIKYQRTAKVLTGADKDLCLNVTFDRAGVYYVDAVQFETGDSTVGIKNYIYNAVADLTPKFMRFPGGCIIEGDSSNGGADTREVYDWKNSVGAVQNGTNAGDDTIPAFTYKLDTDGTAKETTTYGEWITRTNNYDLWGYNMDYGLGFYDYFLLCEKIGASPVPIVNCGFSDQGGASSGAAILLNGRHDRKVADYIQDALNLIEFANGDTTTKWGKIRSDMGHPDPFGLKYIGIGNEQFGPTYFDCYQQFLEVFHAKQKETPAIYGGVQPIVGNGMEFKCCQFAPNSENIANNAATQYQNSGKISQISEYGVVDHHYYMGYSDFLYYATEAACIYDKYEREGDKAYKVFVGEYSANSATHYYGNSAAHATSTWITALSEAAYMTALERNGDVVDLAAYAPMFGVSDGNGTSGPNQWPVNMMYFTNTQLLLSPNYFVQKIFMNNSGTHFLNSFIRDREISPDFPYNVVLGDVSVDILYQAITYDETTKDIIVKIVNIDENAYKLNVSLSDSVKSVADVTVLSAESLDAVNRLGENGYGVKTQEYTLGVGKTFGYEAPAFSVSVIRLHTK